MKPPERPCTVCRLKGQTVVATHVACSATGLEWYECGQHGPGEHHEARTGLVPIGEFFRRLPGFKVTRSVVADPHATAILWAFRLRLEGVMPPEQYEAWQQREQAGAPVNELLAELGELDPLTAQALAADHGVNAEGGSA